LLIFGFYYAATFTDFINTPQIKHDSSNLYLTGTVNSIEYTSNKNKIIMSVKAYDIDAGDFGYANIKLSVPNELQTPDIGDTLKINGGIYKPSPASAPQSFDYARWAYFNKLTATGYVSDITVLNHTRTNPINRIRNDLHNKANSFLSDTLILGYKSAIPEKQQEVWTATGVGHIWSISGFHMTLIGGWLFALFYLIFRSIPSITKRIPAKIPAIICSWAGLLCYLFLSGSDVATTRAFLMTSLIFIAFIYSRTAISMRNVALAFCIIFLMNPHNVMQAGFQLSFSAVFGLTWMFTIVKPNMPQNKLLKVIYIAVLTSIIATVFTAPFIIMHFGRFPIYSLLGNLIFLPIFSVMIMPLIFIGTITSVFNFHLPIEIATKIYDFTYEIAIWISELPFATINMPHISSGTAVLFILALMSLILIKPIKLKINYILFLVFTVAGITNIYTQPRIVFFATYDHELVGFVNDNNKLEFNKSRASNHYFAFDTWKKINNENADSKNTRRKHDKGIYRYNTKNFNLVYIQKFVPLMNNILELCDDNNVDFIVSYFDIKSDSCSHKILNGGFVIDKNKHIKYTPTKRRWH
jgi:competence protein ComEC